jgi:hypothetical protein
MLLWPQHRFQPHEADACAAKDRLKAAGIIKSTKGDWRLVAAAQAMRRGEFTDEFDAAAAMGKTIGQRREVENWRIKLVQLEQLAAAPATAATALLVQQAWIEKETPGISQLEVEPLALSPGEKHGKRKLSALSSTPGGSERPTSATVDYTFPPAEGESEEAAKRREERHWHREARKLRSMDLSGAAQAHAAAEAARLRAARELEREVWTALDACIHQIEQNDLANVALVMPPRGHSCWRGKDDSHMRFHPAQGELPSPTEIPLFVGEYAWLISADNDERPLPVDLLDADMVRYHAEEVAHNARAAAVGEQGRTRGHWQKNGHGFGKTFVSSSGMRHFSRRAGYVLASSGAPCAPVAQLARIDQIYSNYSIDVTLLDMETMEFGERIERVPYAQLRTLRDGRLSREVNKPDLTVAARDAAVAELARHHAAHRSAQRRSSPSRQCNANAQLNIWRH